MNTIRLADFMTMAKPQRAATVEERRARVDAALREGGVPDHYRLEYSGARQGDRVCIIWYDDGSDVVARTAHAAWRALFLAGEVDMCWDCFQLGRGEGEEEDVHNADALGYAGICDHEVEWA